MVLILEIRKLPEVKIFVQSQLFFKIKLKPPKVCLRPATVHYLLIWALQLQDTPYNLLGTCRKIAAEDGRECPRMLLSENGSLTRRVHCRRVTVNYLTGDLGKGFRCLLNDWSI